jgi:hypothetical protein
MITLPFTAAHEQDNWKNSFVVEYRAKREKNLGKNATANYCG